MEHKTTFSAVIKSLKLSPAAIYEAKFLWPHGEDAVFANNTILLELSRLASEAVENTGDEAEFKAAKELEAATYHALWD